MTLLWADKLTWSPCDPLDDAHWAPGGDDPRQSEPARC